MRRSTIESKVRRSVPWLTAAGVLIGLLALGLLWLPTDSLVVSFSSLFALVLAFALVTPGFTLALMAMLTPLSGRVLGLLGRLGPRTVSRELSRTSIAIAALMVAVSVIIGVSLMIGSFRSTVQDWLQGTLQADIFVSPPNLTATQATAVLPPGLAGELAQVPGVQRVELARNVNLVSPDLGPVNVTAATGDVSEGRRRFLWAVSDDPEVLWQAMRGGSVIVSEPFVNLRSIPQQGRGYVLRLQGDRGVREFPIAGVYYDYTAGAGNVIMDRTVYRAGWDDDGISSLGLFLTPGQDADRLVQDLQRQFGARAELFIRSNTGLRDAALAIFDRAFAITVALQLLATVVAFIGVLSALLSLQMERTRELGILRATGLTRRQVWGLTLLETGLMGSTAGLLAVPTGLLLAIILIYVINLRSFGWTLLLQVEPRAFVQAFAVAVVAALLAGLYPAWRQARTAPAAALRGE
jgi:putative ABC transport system permease protein